MNLFTWLFGAKKPKTKVTTMFPNHVRDVRYAPTSTIKAESDYDEDYRRNNNGNDLPLGVVIIGEMLSSEDNYQPPTIENQPKEFSGFSGGDFGGGGSGGSYDAPDTNSSDSSYDSGSSDSGSSFDSSPSSDY